MHVYTCATAHTYTLQLQRETWAKPSFRNAKLHTRPLDVNEGAKISPFYKTVQGASGTLKRHSSLWSPVFLEMHHQCNLEVLFVCFSDQKDGMT